MIHYNCKKLFVNNSGKKHELLLNASFIPARNGIIFSSFDTHGNFFNLVKLAGANPQITRIEYDITVWSKENCFWHDFYHDFTFHPKIAPSGFILCNYKNYHIADVFNNIEKFDLRKYVIQFVN